MNCKNHIDTPAVGQCSNCGAGLCHDCMSVFEPPLCYECAKQIYLEDAKLQRKILFSFIASGILGVIIGIIVCVSMELNPGMYVLGIVWGFMAGSSYGMAIIANRGSKTPWWGYILFFLVAYIAAPIYFTIRLVRQIKFAKRVKTERQCVENYPYKNRQ